MDWTRCHVIGHGSSATVSLATSGQVEEVFAVKSVELPKSEILQREQEILSSLKSDYIIGYKGFDITKENNKFMYNIFMDYAPGGTITDQIQSHGNRLDESTIKFYTKQILQGLDYLHSNQIVHCDIKGRNILVTPNGVKIADFGCAKRVNGSEPNPGRISGTPAFMAPEVVRGEEQGFASDIWALGCTIMEMYTGRSPWSNVGDQDPISVIYRIGYSCELPEYSCCLPEQARDFLRKCLNRDAKERWGANQLLNHPFIEEFKEIQSNSPTSVLDRRVSWNSSRSDSGSLENIVRLESENYRARERIQRLSLLSARPTWGIDECWLTTRGWGFVRLIQ